MSISHRAAVDGSTLSVLTGPLVDQAALFGVRNKLYGLGFALVSVEVLEINRQPKPVVLGPSTMAACPEGSLGDQFVKILNEANIFF
jgi:hypothetical protein